MLSSNRPAPSCGSSLGAAWSAQVRSMLCGVSWVSVVRSSFLLVRARGCLLLGCRCDRDHHLPGRLRGQDPETSDAEGHMEQAGLLASATSGLPQLRGNMLNINMCSNMYVWCVLCAVVHASMIVCSFYREAAASTTWMSTGRRSCCNYVNGDRQRLQLSAVYPVEFGKAVARAIQEHPSLSCQQMHGVRTSTCAAARRCGLGVRVSTHAAARRCKSALHRAPRQLRACNDLLIMKASGLSAN